MRSTVLSDKANARLPIWGWGPTAGQDHLDPWSAAEATRVIEPRMVVPIHWGT
jgi:L-ascorbate metabolism protein UlaG (beta-lactamase superfamily)